MQSLNINKYAIKEFPLFLQHNYLKCKAFDSSFAFCPVRVGHGLKPYYLQKGMILTLQDCIHVGFCGGGKDGLLGMASKII